jgi:superfamily II DNA/RNA helicase
MKRNGTIESTQIKRFYLFFYRLRRGLNILISTPGRLCDHIDNTQSLSFKNIQFLIFDEADK